jgi:hypothetical protein
MSVAYMSIAIIIGAFTVVALWLYNPVLAIVCAPLAASLATAFAAVATALPKREQRKRVSSAAGLRAH